MCGLAGVLNLDGAPVAEELPRRMAAAIAHRGPDGEGAFVEGPLGLGHRRLAVIAPEAGAQPMRDRGGRYALVYNGMVYNYRELRRELEREGVAFRGGSDTEVVLAALIHWGVAGAVARFNGMFALALWDGRERRLYLARDRYGIKPLYHARVGSALLFGSEIKALLVHPALEAEMDLEALVEYFTFQNLFTDRTLFAGVRTFPAGHWAVVEEGALRLHRYWDFDFREPEAPRREEEYLEELDHLFSRAVRRQMVADVPVGTYLSGGIDSGAITAVAARERPGLPSFTCGFDLSSAGGMELSFDERSAAEAMSYRFGTEHYQMVLKAGDMERGLPAVVGHLEEPRVGQSYPNYYIARLASKFSKVVLTGTGGDELFAGYPWRYYRTVESSDFEHFIDDYYRYWQRLIPNRLLWKVFAPIKAEVGGVWTRDIFRDVFAHRCGRLDRPEEYVNRSLYFEAKTFLHGLLTVEDKLSMAHGLENRVPFLDNDLVDFSMAVPVGLKLGGLDRMVQVDENEPGRKVENYYRRHRDGKLLLRKALARHVPEETAGRAKQGFSAPDGSWFRGESIDFVRRRLMDDDERAPIYRYLDRRVVRALVEEHLQGVKNRRLLVWSLLNVDEWCRRFLQG